MTKKQFLKTENVVTGTNSTIKPSRGGFNSRLNTVEERINELEKRVEDAQRTEMVKKKLGDTDNRIRIFNVCLIEIPERV